MGGNESYKFTAAIKQTYRNINSIYIGKEPASSGNILSNRLSVRFKIGYDKEKKEVLYETCNCGYNLNNGLLSGLVRFYRYINSIPEYKALADVQLIKLSEQDVEILLPDIGREPSETSGATTSSSIVETYNSVFRTKNLQHINIEPFRPENLKFWSPQTETDLYMVFGILEDYTNFKYCCGASKDLLDRLGYKADTKPDSILINQENGEYCIGEFKLDTEDFSKNHKKEDIDVLIVWTDSYSKDDRDSVLPHHIINLSHFARNAAIDSLATGDEKTK